MQFHNNIIEQIYNKIIELSDLCLQRKLWLNKNNDTGFISSYTELINSLFDDFNFDDFIDNSAIEVGFSSTTVLELGNLRELINNYKEKESDEEIIKDPEWEKIVRQAKIVLKEWNKRS